MKTKKSKPKNRIKTSPQRGTPSTPAKPTTPTSSPTANTSSAASGKPSSKPNRSTPTTPSPAAETKTPNGSEPNHKFYVYELHAETGIDSPYLESCIANLAGKSYPNIGALVLAIYAKFVGVRQVTELSLRWVTNVFRMDVMVKLAGWDHSRCVAWFQPTDEWYMTGQAGEEVERHAPPKYAPAVAKPLDPSLLDATRPLPGEVPNGKPKKADKVHIDPALLKTPPKGKPRVVLGVELSESDKGTPLLFGHLPTAIARWCGRDAWAELDVFKMFIALGLGDRLNPDTIRSHMKMGKMGRKSRKPIPELSQQQEDALLGVVEKTTIKPGKKKPK